MKINYCDKTIGILSNIKNEVSKLLVVKPGEHTILSQKQIVILFYHMQELRYLGKGMSKDRYAALVAELTAYSPGNIRQDLSKIKKNPPDFDTTEFSETDFTFTKRDLRKLINVIDEDIKQKFPSKS